MARSESSRPTILAIISALTASSATERLHAVSISPSVTINHPSIQAASVGGLFHFKPSGLCARIVPRSVTLIGTALRAALANGAVSRPADRPFTAVSGTEQTQ